MTRRLGLLALLVGACARTPLPSPILPLTPSPDAPFRKVPPPLEVTPVNPPAVRAAVLPNGMQVLVVERPALPLVTLAWASQTAHDGPLAHEQGLAALTASALTEGTRLSDGQVLAHVRINGSRPRIAVDDDGTIVSLHAPSAALSVGMDVLAAVVRRPTLTVSGVATAREDQLEAIQSRANGVRYWLKDAALDALFGSGHAPLSPLGHTNDVLGFTPQAVARFHAARYAPETSALVAVGAVTLEEIVELADRQFGDWPKSTTPPPAPRPLPTLKAPGAIQAIDGGTPDSWVVLVLPCPPAGDVRSADFDLLAAVLANAQLSRTVRRLRHDAGIAYGVNASFTGGRGYGTFWLHFGVEPERVGEALEQVLAEIRRLREQEVPGAELELARIQLLGRAGGQLSTNDDIADLLAGRFLLGQPPDSVARWLENMRSSTSERVRESARLYFTGPVGIAVYGPRDAAAYGLTSVGRVEWSSLKFPDE